MLTLDSSTRPPKHQPVRHFHSRFAGQGLGLSRAYKVPIMRVRALTVGVTLLRQDLQPPGDALHAKLAAVRQQLDAVSTRLEEAGYE